MRINILRHDCSIGNIVQIVNGIKTTKCGFYWKMRGGKTYIGSMHFFTLFGYRVVFDLTIKKKREDLYIK